MKLLLDTHVLIWSAGNPEKLSNNVKDLLTDINNIWVLSIASIWEMQIKVQTGKLNLHSTLPNLIANQQRVNNLQLLPIEVNHIWALADLVHHHRDPFDRILVAQAIVQKMPVLSMDEVLDSYLVERLW